MTEQATRDLVFLGGGHTHALVLKQFAMGRRPNARITLISESVQTPYSGMLPGFIAGHYSSDEIHINLASLCRHVGVRWIHATAVGLDLTDRKVLLGDGRKIAFDVLSIDIGSTPDNSILGAAEHALGVKPIAALRDKWLSILARTEQVQRIAVVGAGAAGVEMAHSVAHRLGEKADVSLVFNGARPLKGYPDRTVRTVEQSLEGYGIRLHNHCRVSQITATGYVDQHGKHNDADLVMLCTPAAAPAWPSEAGLDTDSRGFVAVNAQLQSLSHPFVFAAGDAATMVDDPRPKAGVYAVRQAPFLANNLIAVFADQPLKPAKLQRNFLSLLALGGKRAVGGRGPISLHGDWVWRWKDRIDRKFMAMFQNLPPSMAIPMASESMRCAGCGSKLGPSMLGDTLRRLGAEFPVVFANPPVEDAALLSLQGDYLKTIDGFRAFADDPYRFARVATLHAISDLYAMGQRPQHLSVWASVPFNHPRLQQRDFDLLMRGVVAQCAEDGVSLIGGHSTEGAELQLGLTVGGAIDGPVWPKRSLQPGDCLVLTKPIGVGTLLVAMMQNELPPEAETALWEWMLISNRHVLEACADLTVNAATDVTGFGLLGHLQEMLAGSSRARLHVGSVPQMPSAEALWQQGIQSTLAPSLLAQAQQIEGFDMLPESMQLMCCDPQTSGGLLLSMPLADAQRLQQRLPAWIIGEVIGGAGASIEFVD
ncbi:MAG: selenide, water dikinase SelD [Gammaproteobacteria bacterium]|nr:selenide, water dikinase SelD [Gammaproteobacteria bacterium]